MIVNPIAIRGEDLAEQYLKKNGYKILERNYSKRYGEIDIVAINNNILVFVEVKTRSSNRFGSPLEAITHWKLRSVIKTAQYYKITHPKLPEQMRIDAISVIISSDGSPTIEHIKNISQ